MNALKITSTPRQLILYLLHQIDGDKHLQSPRMIEKIAHISIHIILLLTKKKWETLVHIKTFYNTIELCMWHHDSKTPRINLDD